MVFEIVEMRIPSDSARAMYNKLSASKSVRLPLIGRPKMRLAMTRMRMTSAKPRAR